MTRAASWLIEELLPRCRQGHEMTGWRRRQHKRGRYRYCLECNRDSYRRWYDTHKRKPG
jgi:hypothetical protein